jgi:hypothetical protein
LVTKLPDAATAPVSGWLTPILMTFDWAVAVTAKHAAATTKFSFSQICLIFYSPMDGVKRPKGFSV